MNTIAFGSLMDTSNAAADIDNLFSWLTQMHNANS